VDAVKPDPAAYLLALNELGVEASKTVAIEDNVDGVSAAQVAGIVCVAFPNANTAAHDFSAASASVDEIDLAHLKSLVPAA
jgi:beta-phosphoglucomutase-like phosphatase (HAD superfamily)